MKRIALLVLCLLQVAVVVAQKRITIKGTIKGMESGTVKLYLDPPLNTLLDSCKFSQGKFRLSADIQHIMGGMLYFEAEDKSKDSRFRAMKLMVEPAELNIEYDCTNPRKPLISNGFINDEEKRYKTFIDSQPESDSLNSLFQSINLAYTKADMNQVRSLSLRSDSLRIILIDRILAWDENSRRSHCAAYEVYKLQSSMPLKLKALVISKFDPAFADSYYLNLMRSDFDHENRLRIGNLAPNFSLQDVNGKEFTLADFAGKYLFMEFSASWCGWCKKEIPFIRDAYHKLRDRGVVFLTVNLDDQRERWVGDIKKENIEWLCLSDLQGMKGVLVKNFNIGGIPASFILSPEGKIIARDLRGGEIVQFFDKQLK